MYMSKYLYVYLLEPHYISSHYHPSGISELDIHYGILCVYML